MTNAFTSHGLLSAGLHGKKECSADRQEEVAHESEAALLNVALKPSWSQTGLLGAITASPTEHEREKRAVEERQVPTSSGDDGGDDDTDGPLSAALAASTEDLKARTSHRLE
jgi:hypothetical protein